MVLMPLLSRLLTLLVILTMPLFLARLTLIPIKSLSICFRSEERFSRNAEPDLVCRLLLEKKSNHVPAEVRDPVQGLAPGRPILCQPGCAGLPLRRSASIRSRLRIE